MTDPATPPPLPPTSPSRWPPPPRPPLPPPPSPPTPFAGLVPGPARRAVAVVAVVVATTGFVMWLLSFVPGAPTARFWPAIVFPAFVAMFPCFGLMVLETSARQKRSFGGARRRTFPLRGWRRWAAAAVGACAWLSFMATLFSGQLAGQPYEADGRYYTNNHGIVTEVSQDEWARSNALASRIFAGGVLAFGGVAALYLTQPADDDEPGAAWTRILPAGRRTSWLRRLRGYREIELAGPGTLDDALGRLRAVLPLRAQPGRTMTQMTVLADWDEKMRWPNRTFPMRLEGELTATRSSEVGLSVRLGPATTAASWMPLQALWGLVVVAFGVAIFLPAIAIGPTVAFLPLWAGWGLFVSFHLLTAPGRAANAVTARVGTALRP